MNTDRLCDRACGKESSGPLTPLSPLVRELTQEQVAYSSVDAPPSARVFLKKIGT